MGNEKLKVWYNEVCDSLSMTVKIDYKNGRYSVNFVDINIPERIHDLVVKHGDGDDRFQVNMAGRGPDCDHSLIDLTKHSNEQFDTAKEVQKYIDRIIKEVKAVINEYKVAEEEFKENDITGKWIINI